MPRTSARDLALHYSSGVSEAVGDAHSASKNQQKFVQEGLKNYLKEQLQL